MRWRDVLRGLPGLCAFLLILAAATTAAVLGAGSLFYEAWGQPPLRMAAYLAPAGLLIVVGLVALQQPFVGGLCLVVLGVAAGWRWVATQVARGNTHPESLLVPVAVMVAPILLASVLFLVDASARRCRAGATPDGVRGRVLRYWRHAALLVLPVLAVVTLASQQVPALLARLDDGVRGRRVIGSGTNALVWAPRGPGWNARDSDGEYPTWLALARHRGSMRDRCQYLSADGAALLDVPANIWRLPSASEIVEALTRAGRNAGCRWDRRAPHSACKVPPDKETPLWAPDEAPIYYWSGQEASAGRAFAVNYTGGLSVLPKSVGGLGIGFRCVKPDQPTSPSSPPPSSPPTPPSSAPRT